MGKVIDKRPTENLNLQVENKNERGKGNFEKVTVDPDWSLNQDWDSKDWDLSPKN